MISITLASFLCKEKKQKKQDGRWSYLNAKLGVEIKIVPKLVRTFVDTTINGEEFNDESRYSKARFDQLQEKYLKSNRQLIN